MIHYYTYWRDCTPLCSYPLRAPECPLGRPVDGAAERRPVWVNGPDGRWVSRLPRAVVAG